MQTANEKRWLCALCCADVNHVIQANRTSFHNYEEASSSELARTAFTNYSSGETPFQSHPVPFILMPLHQQPGNTPTEIPNPDAPDEVPPHTNEPVKEPTPDTTSAKKPHVIPSSASIPDISSVNPPLWSFS